MAWTWVRPADSRLLAPRPLLDVGTGDGQTLRALVEPHGLVVGVDRAVVPMRALPRAGVRVAAAEAAHLPFKDGSFDAVLAGDLFHHLDDQTLASVVEEIRRVLGPDGVLVAWWYTETGRAGVDSPRYPRNYESVAALAEAYIPVEPLELTATLEPSPPTAGLLGKAG